jgi:Winged helix DNA-binding domain
VSGRRLTDRALNRALLARQGLVERWRRPVAEAVEAIGAMQAQHWPALPVGLWSRLQDFRAEDLYAALERRELVTGILLRGTLHLTSARDHPAYAVVAAAAGAGGWWPVEGEPPPAWEEFRSELLAFTAAAPRDRAEVAAFAEAWVERRPHVLPEAALAHHRRYSWRGLLRWSSLVRAPAGGSWGPRAPEGLLAAPSPPSVPAAPGPAEAQAAVVRRHLRAFGPAAAEDVAAWVGWKTPAARAALDRLEPELERFEDESGRRLYDLPDAPRPDPEVPAPVRFLPAFDSVQLAYAPNRRQRFLPDAYRDLVYVRANLQVLPTVLVDGLVAGRWSLRTERREAVLSVQPFARLPRPARRAVQEEAERLVRFAQPAAKAHAVELGDG